MSSLLTGPPIRPRGRPGELTSAELREWLDQIDQRKARYYETYEEDLSDTKTLRGSTVRYFTKQFVSEGISRSEAIQRAKAYVDSPAYRSHFNYLRKGLSETRAKARKGQL